MILVAAYAAAALSALPGWGQCSRDLGSEALAACTRVLENPNLAAADKPEVLRARADQYKGTQRLDEALKDLDAAVALKPDFTDAWRMRAQIHERQGRPDLALDDHNHVLDQAPGDAAALASACTLSGAMGRDLDKAPARCDATIAAMPSMPGAYYARGLVRLRLGDVEKSRADFDKALALDARNASALYLRGVLRSRTGDQAGGKADLDAAAAIDPQVAELYAAYGVTP